MSDAPGVYRPEGKTIASNEARQIIQRLRATYCEYIGVEMNHISDVMKRAWLQERMEPVLNAPPIDRDTQLH